MVLLLNKLYLSFTKDPGGSIIYQGGGGNPTFSRGVQMLISIETQGSRGGPLFTRGGGVVQLFPGGS